MQVLLGKFVHVVQFRRPLFTLVEHSWKRVHAFSAGGALREFEIDECMVSNPVPLTASLYGLEGKGVWYGDLL